MHAAAGGAAILSKLMHVFVSRHGRLLANLCNIAVEHCTVWPCCSIVTHLPRTRFFTMRLHTKPQNQHTCCTCSMPTVSTNPVLPATGGRSVSTHCLRTRMQPHAVQCKVFREPDSDDHSHSSILNRRTLAASLLPTILLAVLSDSPAHAFTCPGLNGYALKQCLREARAAKEAAEAANENEVLSVEDEKLKTRQYEQPGVLVTLPSGVQYREIEVGTVGPAASLGDIVAIQYTVYRLSSGAYYKYSSGGTPVLLWSLGSGFEGRDDAFDAYRFRLGDANSLPRAATPAVVSMRAGGRRRILIPPAAGWIDDQVGPRPPTFGGQRRLAAHRDEPLLFEVQVLKVLASGSIESQSVVDAGLGNQVYKLPAPPSPFKDLLGTGAEN